MYHLHISDTRDADDIRIRTFYFEDQEERNLAALDFITQPGIEVINCGMSDRSRITLTESGNSDRTYILVLAMLSLTALGIVIHLLSGFAPALWLAAAATGIATLLAIRDL